MTHASPWSTFLKTFAKQPKRIVSFLAGLFCFVASGAVLLDVLGTPQPETWRVLAASIGFALFAALFGTYLVTLFRGNLSSPSSSESA